MKARTKKEKPQILDEYCRNAGQARKYVIRKIQPGVELRSKLRKKRKQTYDGQVTVALAKLSEIFDYHQKVQASKGDRTPFEVKKWPKARLTIQAKVTSPCCGG